MTHLVQPVLIALLVIVEVGVFHLRVALAGRGRRSGATALGAVNAVISVAALGQVLTNLDRPLNVVGYAVGVSIGVYLGCVADDRLRRGRVDRRPRDTIGSPVDHSVDHRVDQGGVGGRPVQARRGRRSRRGAQAASGAGRGVR
jgi:uncharacterized protein YebE (UPF0316 family)